MWLRRLLVGCVAVWIGIALVAGLGPWADLIVLLPTAKVVAAPKDLTRLTFPWQRGNLEIWSRKSAMADQGKPPIIRVLRFCGQGDLAQQEHGDICDLLEDVSIEYWTMNYPGFGTYGPARLSGIAPAALATYDELAKIRPSCPIVVSANSLGTVPALCVAARRPVAGVVIQRPPPLREVLLRHGWWNLWSIAFPMTLHVPAELDSIANATHVGKPGVVLITSKDEIVPPDLQARISNAYAGPKHEMVIAARHNQSLSDAQREEMKQHLLWLLQQMPPAPKARSL